MTQRGKKYVDSARRFDRQRLYGPLEALENFRAVIDELNRAKPAAAKGRYMKSIAVSSTMGPGIKIDTNRLRLTDEELAGAAAG